MLHTYTHACIHTHVHTYEHAQYIHISTSHMSHACTSHIYSIPHIVNLNTYHTTIPQATVPYMYTYNHTHTPFMHMLNVLTPLPATGHWADCIGQSYEKPIP